MKNILNYIFIGGFFILLWSPYFRMNYDSNNQLINTENRKLTSMPTITFNDPVLFINEFEKYFRDRFGFRNNLISWNSYLSVMLINESPVSTVVLGSKGWLFYSEELVGKRKMSSYSADKLQLISFRLEEQTKYLNEKGIMLITVIAPDKHTIYPEMLPFYLRNYASNPRLEQRLSYLKRFKNIQEVDLVQPLITKKNENDLYYKTDTHWNNYGSFIAYQEIMKVIKTKFPKVEILSKEDFEISTSHHEGDLLKILALPFKFTDDKEVMFTLKGESRLKKLSEDKIIPKVLISHDSFFDPQYPWGTVNFLSNHFSKVIISSSGLDFDYNLIEKEMPNIVILEVVERSL